MSATPPLSSTRPIYPAASARNMALLVQLRWVAAVGQLVAIWVSVRVLGVKLDVAPLVAVPVLMVVINGLTLLLVCRRLSSVKTGRSPPSDPGGIPRSPVERGSRS